MQPESKPSNPILAAHAAHYLEHGIFKFRDLEGCKALANFLAEVCPNPMLALVGINEIFLNAIEHGNLGITYDEKTKLQKENRWIPEIENRLKLPENLNKFVTVEFKRDSKNIYIKVLDQGEGFDWKKFMETKEEPNEKNNQDKDNQDTKNEHRLRTHGRGIPLAQGLAFSELKYFGKGNEVLGVIPLK